MAFYDHIPMSLQYNMNNVEYREDCINEKNFEFVLWDKITEEEIEIYKENVLYLCEEYICESLLCNDLNCKNISAHFKTYKSSKKFKKVTGWNDRCANLHKIACDDFLK